MVGGISSSCLFYGWALWWHQSQEFGSLASCSLLPAIHPQGGTWHLDHPNPAWQCKEGENTSHVKDNSGLLEDIERRDDSTGYCAPEMCYPCQSLSKCVSCRVMQELCKCLPPMVEEGNLPDMETEILEGLGRAPWLPIHQKGPCCQHLKWRSLSTLLHINLHPHLNQKGLHPLRSGPGAKKATATTPRFTPQGVDDPKILPLEDVYRPVAMPMGTLLDLTALETLQVTISHIPATGEVHYHLQAWSITRMFQPGTSSQEQLEPSPKIKELWVIIMFP